MNPKVIAKSRNFYQNNVFDEYKPPVHSMERPGICMNNISGDGILSNEDLAKQPSEDPYCYYYVPELKHS